MIGFFDLSVAVGSIILSLTLIPFLKNASAQSPRWTSSIPIALVLTFWIPDFYIYSGPVSAATLVGQAVAWWLIAIFRPIKKAEAPTSNVEDTEKYVV
jgi:hypothetical protein